jgi:hypothetical protein
MSMVEAEGQAIAAAREGGGGIDPMLQTVTVKRGSICDPEEPGAEGRVPGTRLVYYLWSLVNTLNACLAP